MYFDFEDRHPDIAPPEHVFSPRLGVLVSVGVHVVMLAALLLVPRAVGQRDAGDFMPATVVAEQQRSRPEPFVFIAPRVDQLSRRPPPRAPLSDENREARTVERAPDPTYSLPFSRGNTPERVEARPPEAARGQGPGPAPAPAPPPQPQPSPSLPTGEEGIFARQPPQIARADPSTPPRNPAAGRSTLPGGALGDALRNLERYVQTNQYDNPRGGDTTFGPFIQFDSKGVDFGRWIARFKAQVERNWEPLIPQSAMWMHGHVSITFNVHKSGALTDVAVLIPSSVAPFNTAAFGALTASNPTIPLPAEYPDDKAFFTVTFFYNERPPE